MSASLCRVRACVIRREVDLLIYFRALEFGSRDAILLGSQRKSAGDRGTGLATEVRPQRDKHLGKEVALLLL